jgi:hypothetical protein
MWMTGITLVASSVNSLKSPDEPTAQKLRELGRKVADAIKHQDKH